MKPFDHPLFPSRAARGRACVPVRTLDVATITT
ncbi:hypothetical protein J2X68_000854 [Streptomyces sp. 3330]|nr:hypothetical protein [Streptomyces sp. 3330]